MGIRNHLRRIPGDELTLSYLSIIEMNRGPASDWPLTDMSYRHYYISPIPQSYFICGEWPIFFIPSPIGNSRHSVTDGRRLPGEFVPGSQIYRSWAVIFPIALVQCWWHTERVMTGGWNILTAAEEVAASLLHPWSALTCWHVACQ